MLTLTDMSRPEVDPKDTSTWKRALDCRDWTIHRGTQRGISTLQQLIQMSSFLRAEQARVSKQLSKWAKSKWACLVLYNCFLRCWYSQWMFCRLCSSRKSCLLNNLGCYDCTLYPPWLLTLYHSLLIPASHGKAGWWVSDCGLGRHFAVLSVLNMSFSSRRWVLVTASSLFSWGGNEMRSLWITLSMALGTKLE